MDCERIEALISASIDGEIDAVDVRELASHLEACEACRMLSKESFVQDREMREAFVVRRRSADALRDRLAGTFESAPDRRGSSSRFLSLAAALVIGFLLGWIAIPQLQPPVPAFWSEAVELPEIETGPESDPVPRIEQKPVSDKNPDGIPKRVIPGVEPGPSLARLAFMTGPVEMRSRLDGDWIPLSADQPLSAGTSVRSSAKALCEIHGSDGSSVRLDRSTEIRLLSNRSWELARGRIGSSVSRGSTPFDVRVAGAVVTALGTRFDVEWKRDAEWNRGRAELHVFEGTTRVETGAESRIVRRGERAAIADKIEVHSIERQQLALASSWMNALLVLEGREGKELDQRLQELLAGLGRSKMDLLLENEIRALGSSCVVPLLRYVESPQSDGDPRKRVKAASFVADLATKESIDDLIKLLADPDARIRVEMARALERLTGIDQGFATKRWAEAKWSVCEPAYLRWAEWAKLRATSSVKRRMKS